MDLSLPTLDVLRLYKQWQDGKLLDSDEQQALRAPARSDGSNAGFADVLKRANESDS
ncbi:MAG TPA: hypothetical protein VF157_11235 [Chloroflexota bacterium]